MRSGHSWLGGSKVGKGRGAARGGLRKPLFIAALAAILALGAWVSASAAEAFPPTRLTNNSYDDYAGGVSGDRVVWMGEDESDWSHDPEIYTWTPSGGTVQITKNSTWDIEEEVSGDRVAWTGTVVGSGFEIYTWTPDSGAVRLTDNSNEEHVGGVSGDRVVWRGVINGIGGEIYTWTPTSGTVQITNNSSNDQLPEVSGDRVAWEEWDGADWEIFTWTPTSGTVQLTVNTGEDDICGVSADRVVWERERYVAAAQRYYYEIYTWTPADGNVQLTSGEWDVNPVVSGDRIAWERYDRASEYEDSEIYTWTPEGGVVRVTNNAYEDVCPEISGDRIVWTQEVWDYGTAGLSPAAKSEKLLELGETGAEAQSSPSTLETSGNSRLAEYGDVLESSVMTWTPTGGTAQVASYALDPHVSGNRVVWESFDLNYPQDTEVFTSVAHTRFDDKNAKITYLPGWARWDGSNYWAAIDDTYAYTDKKGDRVMVTFNGTSASVVACTSNTKGKALVRLYNGAAEPANLVSESTVDLYSSTTKWKQRVYSTGTIAAGTHTLVIECLYQKNGASGWYTIDVDGFDILGTLEQSPTVSKIDDKEAGFCTFTPAWARWDNSGYYAAYQDTYAYTDKVGDKMSFTFDGSYAAWVACTSNTKGQALAKLYAGSVDPANLVSSSTVDLYSSSTLWKQKVYDTGFLTPKKYILVIECLGTKNAKSWWNTIDVDRFDAILTTL